MSPDTTPAPIGADAALVQALEKLLANFESQHALLLKLGAPDFVAMRDQARAALTTAAPAAQGDALPREEFAWMVVQEACETEPADEDDPECIRILRRDLKSAVLAAFLREDAARIAKAGDQHG